MSQLLGLVSCIFVFSYFHINLLVCLFVIVLSHLTEPAEPGEAGGVVSEVPGILAVFVLPSHRLVVINTILPSYLLTAGLRRLE